MMGLDGEPGAISSSQWLSKCGLWTNNTVIPWSLLEMKILGFPGGTSG